MELILISLIPFFLSVCFLIIFASLVPKTKPSVIEFDANFDEALLNMSDEEVTFADIDAELSAEIATWDPINQAVWGWLPWFFQWSEPE